MDKIELARRLQALERMAALLVAAIHDLQRELVGIDAVERSERDDNRSIRRIVPFSDK